MNRRQESILVSLYREALAAVDPARVVLRALSGREIALRLRRACRVGVFACGKAAAGMFRGAAVPMHRALLVLPEGYGAPRLPGARVLFASHPEPDRTSVAAARAAAAFFSGFGPRDLILCLISGGTSSLLCLPRSGVTLAEKRRRVRELARSGASIHELNRLRTSLSLVKGGGLGRRTSAALVTLVLSDVPGDDPSEVGSGPTIRGRAEDLVRVVGSNRMGLEAAAALARRRGLSVRVRRRQLAGEAALEGERLARAASALPSSSALLAGGETTVRLGRRPGIGGRSLEVALGAAGPLERAAVAVALLAAGSDGRDGTSRAAGAFADRTTLRRARALGLSPREALERHDTEPFFERLGDLFSPGPTGTNVADWVFAVRT